RRVGFAAGATAGRAGGAGPIDGDVRGGLSAARPREPDPVHPRGDGAGGGADGTAAAPRGALATVLRFDLAADARAPLRLWRRTGAAAAGGHGRGRDDRPRGSRRGGRRDGRRTRDQVHGGVPPPARQHRRPAVPPRRAGRRRSPAAGLENTLGGPFAARKTAGRAPTTGNRTRPGPARGTPPPRAPPSARAHTRAPPRPPP